MCSVGDHVRDAEEKGESELRAVVERFMHQLDVDEEVASILAQEGFSTIEEIAYVPESELVDIEEFDEAEPAEDLLSLEGMDKGLAYLLASKGVVTRDDLAELAVDDLEEIEELEPERAAELIMAARAHWFAEAEAEAEAAAKENA